MRDPNDEPHFYQTGAISEKNIVLIAEALRAQSQAEANANSPDLQKVDDLTVLAEHFEDPEGSLIPVDGPDTTGTDQEDLEVEDDEDEDEGDGDDDN